MIKQIDVNGKEIDYYGLTVIEKTRQEIENKEKQIKTIERKILKLNEALKEMIRLNSAEVTRNE